jgi:hypothetical protein
MVVDGNMSAHCLIFPPLIPTTFHILIPFMLKLMLLFVAGELDFGFAVWPFHQHTSEDFIPTEWLSHNFSMVTNYLL